LTNRAQPLYQAKRKLIDSVQEESMMELSLDEEVVGRDLQKHCFIEELCTCEILELQ